MQRAVRNLEYDTMWDHWRRIFASEFESLRNSEDDGSLTAEDHDSNVLHIVHLDLQFVLPLLVCYPKCY